MYKQSRPVNTKQETNEDGKEDVLNEGQNFIFIQTAQS